jgi:hypothetical protein
MIGLSRIMKTARGTPRRITLSAMNLPKPLRDKEGEVNMPAMVKKRAIPNNPPQRTSSATRLNHGSPSSGSYRTQDAIPVQAMLVWATITPVTRATFRLST